MTKGETWDWDENRFVLSMYVLIKASSHKSEYLELGHLGGKFFHGKHTVHVSHGSEWSRNFME